MTIAEDIMQKIVVGADVPSSVDGHHAAELYELLKAHGATDYDTYSSCTVATSEFSVQLPNGLLVEVVESNFFGPFTDIKVL